MADWGETDGGQLWVQGTSVAESTSVLSGVLLTAGAAHVKPVTSLALFTATRHYTGFLLQVSNASGSFPLRYAMDLSWDSAAAQIFVANIILQSTNTGSLGYVLYFPMEIPSGATVYGRFQCNVSSITLYAQITGMAGAGRGYTRCQTLGAVATGSATRGTAVVAATAPTEGGWTAVATVGETIRAVTLLIGNQGAQETTSRWLWDIGISASSTVLLPNIFQATTTAADTLSPQAVGPLPLMIPAGTLLAARLSVTPALTTTPDISILGFS